MRGSERVNGRWVSLAVASQLLGVNKATLRQWADRGVLRTFRTPGGHRRFARQDLLRLAGKPAMPATDGAHPALGPGAVKRVRRRFRYARAETTLWQASLDPEAMERLRAFGRQLQGMAVQYSTRPRSRRDVMAQGIAIGEEQGLEMARRGVPLEEATRVYLVCRNSYLDALAQAWGQGDLPGAEFRGHWKQALAFLDSVLIAMIAGYGKTSTQPELATA